MIPADEGAIPWWRLLWSLLFALIIGAVGMVALMTDMKHPSPGRIVVELVTLPLVRPSYYLLGLTSDAAVLASAAASVVLWWCIILIMLRRRTRRHGQVRPA